MWCFLFWLFPISSIIYKIFTYFYFLYITVFLMYVDAPHVCLLPAEVKKRYWISWNYSYNWLWFTIGLLGHKLRYSTRSLYALNPWVLTWRNINHYQLPILHILWWSRYFSLSLSLCYIYFNDQNLLNQTYVLGMKSTCSWYMISMRSWILFVSILLRLFASMIIKKTGL